MVSVLVVERDPQVMRGLAEVLVPRGYRPIEACDAASAMRSMEKASPKLAILGDVACQGGAMYIARLLLERWPDIPLLFFVAESSEELAIAALKTGVRDYIKQPAYGEVAVAVDRCLKVAGGRESPDPGRHEPRDPGGQWSDSCIAGRSLILSRIRLFLRKVAAADCNVLISGETGTGKELIARAIHQNSPRRHKPFVAINCAAIPDSLLESELFGHERGAFTGAHADNCGKLMQADGGTVFLDEIGEMDPCGQAKILRAIENKEVQRLGANRNRTIDIRIVTATNQDLDQLILLNKFRRDLYFRLSVTQVKLPPLRERLEDVPVLADFFIAELNRRLGREVRGLSPELIELLLRYSWPGNVRELKNLLEALFVNSSGNWMTLEDLPEHLRHLMSRRVPDDERTVVLRALQATRWNKTKAAQELRWSRMTLYRKMARYQIASSSQPGNVRDGAVAVSA